MHTTYTIYRHDTCIHTYTYTLICTCLILCLLSLCANLYTYTVQSFTEKICLIPSLKESYCQLPVLELCSTVHLSPEETRLAAMTTGLTLNTHANVSRIRWRCQPFTLLSLTCTHHSAWSFVCILTYKLLFYYSFIRHHLFL